MPIDELIGAFIDEGAAEGVRGDMAFAQSIHETGSFANSDTIGRNNFAGIGHCEACGGGFAFATAQIGVRAQIQLLKSYAEEDPTYNSPRADPELNGPAGCCSHWMRPRRRVGQRPELRPAHPERLPDHARVARHLPTDRAAGASAARADAPRPGVAARAVVARRPPVAAGLPVRSGSGSRQGEASTSATASMVSIGSAPGAMRTKQLASGTVALVR